MFQIVDPQYGMFTWPAAPVLAQFIWHNKEQVKGKQVIEVQLENPYAFYFQIKRYDFLSQFQTKSAQRSISPYYSSSFISRNLLH